ncbi:MAG: hypothetical protein Q4C25_02860, partial [Bacillota bacterium]|nr:hypothetical protein [Bacillota bacterium]
TSARRPKKPSEAWGRAPSQTPDAGRKPLSMAGKSAARRAPAGRSRTFAVRQDAMESYIRSLETLEKSGLISKQEMHEMIAKHQR